MPDLAKKLRRNEVMLNQGFRTFDNLETHGLCRFADSSKSAFLALQVRGI